MWIVDENGVSGPGIRLVIPGKDSAAGTPLPRPYSVKVADSPRHSERVLEPGFKFERYAFACPRCPARPVAKASTLAALVRQAQEAGESEVWLA